MVKGIRAVGKTVTSFAAIAANDGPLDALALKRLTDVTRAVSWVERRHGTATTQQGTRDPMQCGHPQDAWWGQLIALGGPGQDETRRMSVRARSATRGPMRWASSANATISARCGRRLAAFMWLRTTSAL
jgi:hypothetical protein